MKLLKIINRSIFALLIGSKMAAAQPLDSLIEAPHESVASNAFVVSFVTRVGVALVSTLYVSAGFWRVYKSIRKHRDLGNIEPGAAIVGILSGVVVYSLIVNTIWTRSLQLV